MVLGTDGILDTVVVVKLIDEDDELTSTANDNESTCFLISFSLFDTDDLLRVVSVVVRAFFITVVFLPGSNPWFKFSLELDLT